ncbi:MAG TPA: TRC40/GET3/ArsA family transport-energizing ATPase [Actinomycetota bacterium]|nr:TRC40/GET3/ArsA family transport-energizing ATPase [Actinomycetota bacterium]
MRILLFTGKGGVGKTTVSAATAVHAARRGLRTLVMSTDPAHSLADAMAEPLDGEPREVAPNLWGQQIDAQKRLEEGWREIQEYVLTLLDWGGVDAIAAEELSVIPGLDEIFALTDVRRAADSMAYDLLVVDCAPTAETLRLLSLPDALNWYFERIFPMERRIAKVARPVVNRMVKAPIIASDTVMGAVERLHRTLESVRRLLIDTETSSVRLVVNAERMVIAEARRTYTYLNLFGYRVDAVVCNRLLPETITDPYFEEWKALQKMHLGTIHESFAPVPIMNVPLYDREMVGLDRLGVLAENLYGETDPAAMLHDVDPVVVRKTAEGATMSLHLPFTEKADIDLLRKGDDLYVKVGPYKRAIMLPVSLSRLEVAGAAFEGEALVVRFKRPPGEEPEPEPAEPAKRRRGRGAASGAHGEAAKKSAARPRPARAAEAEGSDR